MLPGLVRMSVAFRRKGASIGSITRLTLEQRLEVERQVKAELEDNEVSNA